MIPIIGYNTFATPTFKANVSLQIGHNFQRTIDDETAKAIKKQFKQIGDDKDFFEHAYEHYNGKVCHSFEYYRENNKEKRVRFELKDDNYLTVPEAAKILTKAIMAKEPITTQNSNKITNKVSFPELTYSKDLDIKYSQEYSQSEDNFYYKNGNKAVCIQNITPDKGVAEYYDKNGNLQFKKYKNYAVVLTEKYNKDGQISYRIISAIFGNTPPLVFKDDKIFQMYAYKTSPDSGDIKFPDYRILIERNNNNPLRYYLDSTKSGIRPKDAPSRNNYYSIYYINKYDEKMNQEYAKELMKTNPQYTPEHLKELYLLPHNFNKEFIEDNTIFNTNYRIDLVDSRLKPNTEKFGYQNIKSTYEGNYSYETISTKAYGNPMYISEFELPHEYNAFTKFKFFDKLWDASIDKFRDLLFW